MMIVNEGQRQASLSVDFVPGPDCEVVLDGGPGELPYLTVRTATGEVIYQVGDGGPTPSDLKFAASFATGTADWRDRLVAYADTRTPEGEPDHG